jgi:hypothetical protein
VEIDEDKFFYDLEVMHECRALLLSGSTAKARMALILLDSLIDAVLYRRLELAYMLSEENWYMGLERFPKSIRTSARKNFEERLRLARRPLLGPFHGSSPQPLVDDVEAEVILIGHSYRNAAYHRDTHNPAIIRPLATLLFHAVAQAFARGHEEILIVYPSQAWKDELAAFGLSAEELAVRTRGEAAAAVAAKLTEGLEEPLTEIAERFADDLDARAVRVDDLLDELPLDPASIDEMLAEQEFWDKHGMDDELIRLADIVKPVRRLMALKIEPGSKMFDEIVDEATRVEPDYMSRLNELRSAAGPSTVSLGFQAHARHTAKAIRQSQELSRVLSDYQGADRDLGVLERYLDEAVMDYDRWLSLQRDIERGK